MKFIGCSTIFLITNFGKQSFGSEEKSFERNYLRSLQTDNNGPRGNGPQGNGGRGNSGQGNGGQGNGGQGNGGGGNGGQGNGGQGNGGNNNEEGSNTDCNQHPNSLAGCIRFSKIIENRSITNPSYPLGRDQYPFSNAIASNVRSTDAVSVVDSEQDFFSWQEPQLIQWAGGPPSYPTCGDENDHAFWNEMREVIEVQLMRKEFGDVQGSACQAMPLPNLWKDFSLNEAAEAVHDEVRLIQCFVSPKTISVISSERIDLTPRIIHLYTFPFCGVLQYPGLHQANLIADIMGKTYGEIVFDEQVLNGYAKRFLRGIVMLADLNTWAVSTIGDYNFFLKWNYGRPRPEVSVGKR